MRRPVGIPWLIVILLLLVAYGAQAVVCGAIYLVTHPELIGAWWARLQSGATP